MTSDLTAKSVFWHEAFGTERLPSAYDDVLADDFRALFFGHGWVTKEQYVAGDQEFAKAFEDVDMRVDHAVQERNTVFCRMTWTGRQVGEVLGVAPSGRQFEVLGVAPSGRQFEVLGFCEDTFRDGFVVEHISFHNRISRLAWRSNSKLLRRKSLPSGQSRIFDRLVPLPRRLEGDNPSTGLSLIAVGRKAS